jgi:hypothetical protein
MDLVRDESALRRWCLERAFETRALVGVPHFEVTNEAAKYYGWIKHGISQVGDLYQMEATFDGRL